MSAAGARSTANKPDPEFIDERSPDYKRVEQLPFVHLLSNEGSSEPIATSFCEIVRHSDTWNGKQVRFRASVISDGIDHTALAAAECSGRIIPRISEGAGNHPDVQAFTRCLFLDKPRGTAFKHVSAVFAGRFVWDQTTRVLEVEEVKDLRVNPKKNMP